MTEVQLLVLGILVSCAWLFYALLSGRILLKWRWYYRDESPKLFWFVQFGILCGLLFLLYKLIDVLTRQ
jgi:hypothetical protein